MNVWVVYTSMCFYIELGGSGFLSLHSTLIFILQAYEMCWQIANGSDKHFDIPRYVVNIGETQRELGKHEQAIECMTRSLDLERSLGVGASVVMCATQECIALSYCALER